MFVPRAYSYVAGGVELPKGKTVSRQWAYEKLVLPDEDTGLRKQYAYPPPALISSKMEESRLHAPLKPIVIFGVSTFGTLAAHCLKHDSRRPVAAFTVDRRYVQSTTHEGLPLVAFEDLAERFPSEKYDILAPLGYRRINGFRKECCERAHAMGYGLANYVSTRASVWPDTRIGENVIIYEQAVVQSLVQLGHNVTIRSGANIGHHARVGSDVFFASGVVTGGDVIVGERAWIGLGAVIRNNVSIGERCFIGAGAVVVHDTEPDGVYVGVPARRVPGKTSMDVTGG
jgi:sugar O-acyltransferase (sialic acid O-acetyltransferase NeuD family)